MPTKLKILFEKNRNCRFNSQKFKTIKSNENTLPFGLKSSRQFQPSDQQSTRGTARSQLANPVVLRTTKSLHSCKSLLENDERLSARFSIDETPRRYTQRTQRQMSADNHSEVLQMSTNMSTDRYLDDRLKPIMSDNSTSARRHSLF